MANKQQKVQISERSLIMRINRKLRQEGVPKGWSTLQLKKSRPKQELTLGTYYLLDVYENYVNEQNVDLVALGKKLAVLKPWETL